MTTMTNQADRATAAAILAVVVATACGARPAAAQVDATQGRATDPSGVYFHAWTGSTAGTEWLLCFPVGESRYRCANTLGNGFGFLLENDGTIRVHEDPPCQGGAGVALPDRLELDWRCSDLYFSSVAVRAPFTTSDFPVIPGPAAPGDTALSGDWSSSSAQLSPVTGETLRSREEMARIQVRGDTMRVSFPDGTWFQGVFQGENRVVFRVRVPGARDPRFETVRGSASSYAEDILGVARIVDLREIELVVLRQSRAPVGDQVQHLYRYLLRR